MGHPWDTPGTRTSWLVVLQDGRTELAEAIASTEGVRVGHATWTKGATFTATGIQTLAKHENCMENGDVFMILASSLGVKSIEVSGH